MGMVNFMVVVNLFISAIVHVINFLHCTYFIAVDCGSLEAPFNGAVDTSSGTTFMMTAIPTTVTLDTFSMKL